MALVSPGIQVSVIDESFYTPAEPGTTPMLFVVSAQDKTNAAGTGTALGTTKATAGTPYLITSQRDLSDTFGDPIFQVDTNKNPVNGSELNEYGLQAAYSYLGVSNSAYIVRADIDLNELSPSASAPTAAPANGTNWFDTALTRYGIFEWNGNIATATGGQTFTNKVPTVITSATNLVGGQATGDPKGSVGAVGDYAVVTTTTTNRVYYKNTDGAWVKVGSANWVKSWPTVTGTVANPTLTSSQSIVINGTTVSLGGTDTTVAQMVTAITGAGITGVSAKVVDGKLNLFGDGSNTTDGSTDVDGAILLAAGGSGTLLADLGLTAGTYYSPRLTIAPHTQVPAFKTADTQSRPSGSIWFKTTDPNLGANMKVKQYNSTTRLWVDTPAPVYTTNEAALFNLSKTKGGIDLAVGATYVQAHVTRAENEELDFCIKNRNASGSTKITSSAVTASTLSAGTFNFSLSESLVGQLAQDSTVALAMTATGATSDADLIADAINAHGFTNIVASVDASNRVVIEHNDGGEIKITDTDNLFTLIGFAAYNYSTKAGTANLYTKPTGESHTFTASNWKIMTYSAGPNAPTSLTDDKRHWYSSIVDEVDIMVHNGTTWKGYAGVYSTADPAGPIVSATEPTEQSDTTPLVTGDIWVSTANLENYPQIYKYNADLTKWMLVDSTDQTTEDGILFADARFGTSGGTATAAPSGTIPELLVSDFLDTDAPDPALYPKGMLLWNLRRSGFNVKQFNRNYVTLTDNNVRMSESQATYYPHRWVTVSANQPDGSGTFGRKAQRKVIVTALQSLVNSNQEIRDDESRLFNVMACPSYPELIGEMVALNNDRGLTAFIVGDSPFRLQSDGTSLLNWGSNTALAVEDNDDGAVTRDEYLGMFYPSLFTSDNAGNNVIVPPSHGILRTLALSDQVSFPWFAPAGTRRGGITNASAAGFIDAEGEFKSIALNEGQRDTLYAQNINPITFLTGAGLVNFGQKTRAKNASSLDRINVARLVIFLRSQLNKLAKPYIFEPNDKITRDEIKAQVDSLMLELVSQRALYDFLVVCDESNNTPSRIDRNELYVDIAIEPVKAVEFIYIPLRLKNTGEISGL